MKTHKEQAKEIVHYVLQRSHYSSCACPDNIKPTTELTEYVSMLLKKYDDDLQTANKEIDRLKQGIKSNNITMIVDGNDMADLGWTTILEANKRIHEAKKNIVEQMLPCKDCKSKDINFNDCGYSSFNSGGGRCNKCGRQHYATVGLYPSLKELVDNWNEGQKPTYEELEVEVAALRAKVTGVVGGE